MTQMAIKSFHPEIKPRGILGSEILGVQANTTDELIRILQKGLTIKELENFSAKLLVSNSELVLKFRKPKVSESNWLSGQILASLIGMSESTYQRRKTTQTLTPKESEGLYRYATLLARAEDVLGDSESAKQWLNQPLKALGNKIPLEYAQTEVGANFVIQLLGRLEHGSYS
jgi:putative toxin-antitoxin system antitoxin component (TIGR02293 family)